MKFEYWKTTWETNNVWYWHLKARNGRIMADGNTKSKQSCIRSIKRLAAAVWQAPIVERKHGLRTLSK